MLNDMETGANMPHSKKWSGFSGGVERGETIKLGSKHNQQGLVY